MATWPKWRQLKIISRPSPDIIHKNTHLLTWIPNFLRSYFFPTFEKTVLKEEIPKPNPNKQQQQQKYFCDLCLMTGAYPISDISTKDSSAFTMQLRGADGVCYILVLYDRECLCLAFSHRFCASTQLTKAALWSWVEEWVPRPSHREKSQYDYTAVVCFSYSLVAGHKLSHVGRTSYAITTCLERVLLFSYWSLGWFDLMLYFS